MASTSAQTGRATPADGAAYADMNRMLILSFAEVFRSTEFNDKFNIRQFDRVEALRWIRNSTIAPARRMASRLSSKASKRTTVLKGSTINSADDVVLNELGTKQVAQTMRAALPVHTYGVVDNRVTQAFEITFKKRMCPPALLNAGSYVQRVL